MQDRIFRFKTSGIITEVPAGQCSGPINVPVGSSVIEELIDGRITTGGTFSGDFQLTGVSALAGTSASAITEYNLALRTVNMYFTSRRVQPMGS